MRTHEQALIVKMTYDKILFNGLKVGEYFEDKDGIEPGTYLILAGEPPKKFRSKNNLTLWLVQNARRFAPQAILATVRNFRSEHPYLTQIMEANQ